MSACVLNSENQCEIGCYRESDCEYDCKDEDEEKTSNYRDR